MIARIVGTTGRVFGGMITGLAFGVTWGYKFYFVVGGIALAVICTYAEWKMSKR